MSAEIEPITVTRVARRGSLDGLPGVRFGRVAAYEFDVDPQWGTRTGAVMRQRAFLLLDEQVQLNQPVGFSGEQEGWWYIDLAQIEERGTHVRVEDEYLDLIIGPPTRAYRMMDLDEFGEALRTGAIDAARAASSLAAWQRFLDSYLQPMEGHLAAEWRDFPPAALAPVLTVPIPPR